MVARAERRAWLGMGKTGSSCRAMLGAPPPYWASLNKKTPPAEAEEAVLIAAAQGHPAGSLQPVSHGAQSGGYIERQAGRCGADSRRESCLEGDVGRDPISGRGCGQSRLHSVWRREMGSTAV